MSARTAISAALAASLLAADLVLLTLLLNPALRAASAAPALLLGLFLPYAAAGTVVLCALSLAFASLRFWPAAARAPLARLPWFTSFALLAVSAAAHLFWLNLQHYTHAIAVEAVRALLLSGIALVVAAAVLLFAVLDTLLFPLRPRGVTAALVVLAAASSVVVPLALRPAPRAAEAPQLLVIEPQAARRRVVLIGIDGIGPALLRERIEKGAVPALERMARRGAFAPLATLRPTEGPPIWNSIVTGRLPRAHGVKSFTTYRLAGSETQIELLPYGALVSWLERVGLVATAPATSASRRRRALWNVLNAFGIHTGMVRLWGSYPPERVQGFVLSNYFHLLRKQEKAALTLHPTDLLPEVQARAADAADATPAHVAELLQLAPQGEDAGSHEVVARAYAADTTYHRAGAVLRAAYAPPFFATYFHGFDEVGHRFLRFHAPDAFGDVTPEDRRRYGQVLERYLGFLDALVGDELQALGKGDVLCVVSGYGLEPLPFWRRQLASWLGEPERSARHDAAPDGVVLAVGDGIRAGVTIPRASVLDLAPTILYLMGLPVARDMEGRVLAEMVSDEVARTQPVTFVPSYESLAPVAVAAPFEDDLPPLPVAER